MSRAGFLSKTAALAAKDLRIELRARETLPPMLAFSLTVVLLLAFSVPTSLSAIAPVQLPIGTVLAADLLAGFVWVTILFAGLIGFARTFEIERQDGAIDTLLLAPLDRSGLFVAKAVANLSFILIVEAFVLPLFALFFSVDLGNRWTTLLILIALVDIGFVAVGTLFASVAAQTRSKELMLPILALPVLVPIFIAAVRLTSDLFIGSTLDAIATRGWFGILIGYDVIFGIVAALAFEFAVE